ncbi:Gustatory receptor 175 [Halyomorpha halys]|nr:Gustatory receptor 175 [Halyomorpha halys]
MLRSGNIHEFLEHAVIGPKLFGLFLVGDNGSLSIGALIRGTVTLAVFSFAVYRCTSFLADTNYHWALTQYLDFIELYVLVLAIALCFIISLKLGRQVNYVVNNLEVIHIALNNLNMRISYSYLFIIYHHSIRILFLVVTVVENFLLPLDAGSWWDNLIYMLTLNLAFFILHLFLIPFYGLLYAINIYFTTLRRIVDELKKEMDLGWRQKVERSVHLNIEVYQSCCDVNKLFSSMAFIVVTVAFIIIVKNIYFISYVNIEYNSMRLKVFYHFITGATYILTWVLELCTITFLCADLTSQSKDFNDSIYEAILNDKSRILQKSAQLRVQLAYKPVAVFEAFGFLPLDFTLLHSIAATATTYIVLLIQLGSGKDFE